MMFDVAIVGAGPTGSASAGFLARTGLRVVVLEKDLFPRFRIGESLLPLGLDVLEDLGIDLSTQPYALHKAGARILCESCHQQHRISFADTLACSPDHAFQVERAPFDLHLAERARQLGAEVRFETTVKRYEEHDDRVDLKLGNGTIQARYLIDASGRNALMCGQNRGRTWVRGLGGCASFAHFEDVDPDSFQELFSEGDILILLLPHGGWAWVIPLPNQHISLGVVHKDGCKPRKPEQEIDDLRATSPLLSRLLGPARCTGPVRRESDYSYYNAAPHTRRCVAIGDAHAFLDPVFSSGVSFGLFAARALSNAMRHSIEADTPLDLTAQQHDLESGYLTYERLLERFYRPNWAHMTFFAEEKPPKMVRELNTILAGFVWRSDNAWQTAMDRSRRRSVRYERGKRRATLSGASYAC